MKKRVYHINIIVDELTVEAAHARLREVVDEIVTQGVADCSAHDDTYIPYTWWTCMWTEKEEG